MKPEFKVGDTVKLTVKARKAPTWVAAWNGKSYAVVLEVKQARVGSGYACKLEGVGDDSWHKQWHEVHLELHLNGIQLAKRRHNL